MLMIADTELTAYFPKFGFILILLALLQHLIRIYSKCQRCRCNWLSFKSPFFLLGGIYFEDLVISELPSIADVLTGHSSLPHQVQTLSMQGEKIRSGSYGHLTMLLDILTTPADARSFRFAFVFSLRFFYTR